MARMWMPNMHGLTFDTEVLPTKIINEQKRQKHRYHSQQTDTGFYSHVSRFLQIPNQRSTIESEDTIQIFQSTPKHHAEGSPQPFQ